MGQSGYVLAAVFVVWLALGAYLLWIAGLVRRTQRDLAGLEERLEEAGSSSRAEQHGDRDPASVSGG